MKLAQQIIKGNRTALGQGITLIESTLKKDQKKAENLLSICLPYSGKSIRIGVTGVPGVGKSTLIESLGKIITKKGKKVGVLSIDPTSKKNQGSILGDKSRMNKLSSDKHAFIRPSPNSGILGGIANKTKESITLLEAAGYNVILIETVGVGQSETMVSNLVDFFLLLMLAGAGDELQGIKRGVMELADALIINKADGNNIKNAENAALNYKKALHLFPYRENGWVPKVSTCSAINNKNITTIWKIINTYDSKMTSVGWKHENRKKQELYWLHHRIKEEIGNKKYQELISKGAHKILEKKVLKGYPISKLLSDL